jgi:hypothetical protein
MGLPIITWQGYWSPKGGDKGVKINSEQKHNIKTSKYVKVN